MMEKRSFLTVLEKMDVRFFIGILFLYQLILIFQGFDIADEGFYATFYQRIYSDPESVQYNFMFWLTGIIGNWFAGLGLFWIRIAGILVITSTATVTYNLLKKYLHTGHLKIGLFLVVLLLNNNRKTIYYDNLSLLFYLLIILFLFTGLRDKKLWKIFLSGAFIGVNIFTRPPNVMALGLGIVILYYAFLHKTPWKQVIGQILVWGAGLIVSTAVLLGLMKALGHYDYFVNSLKLLSSMGADEGNKNYGFMNMIKNYYPPYTTGLVKTVIVLAIIGVAAVAPGFVKGKNIILKLLKIGFAAALLALVLYMFIKDKEENVLPLYLFTGITIITGVIILLTKTVDKNIKVLMLAGCYLVAAYPFGSSSGLYTVGINTFWIAIPIAVHYWFSHRPVSLAGFQLSTAQFRLIGTFTVILLACGCLLHAYFYPYFDRKNRISMTHSINSKYTRGIFTSEERATSINQLLAESGKYIKPNDFVLAYDCMPMYHYITETRPYIRNSWPYLYSKDIFKDELQKAKERTNVLPVVVMQTIKTIGSGADWPTVPLKQDAEWTERNKGRNDFLQEFLTTNSYKEVWTNGMFKIFVAGRDSL